jgi:hypothetical protein
LYRSGKRAYPLIKSLPPVPECSILVKLPDRPISVQLQPQGKPVEHWQYQNGQLSVEVPGFAVHQMVVIE